MLFLFRTAAQVFQQFIDQVLHDLHFCYAYVDNIFITSANQTSRSSTYGWSFSPSTSMASSSTQPSVCLGLSSWSFWDITFTVMASILWKSATYPQFSQNPPLSASFVSFLALSTFTTGSFTTVRTSFGLSMACSPFTRTAPKAFRGVTVHCSLHQHQGCTRQGNPSRTPQA